MVAVKRRSDGVVDRKASKRTKVEKNGKAVKKTPASQPALEALPLSDSGPDSDGGLDLEDNADTSEVFDKFSDDDEEAEEESKKAGLKGNTESTAGMKPKANGASGDAAANVTGTSSRESHAKQKNLVQERKAAKPNADSIARSKKLWERLRRKSHVPKEEREALVKELFEIITGRVKEFVFKHDSVRVVQTALKYATPEQRRQIARELKGSYRELAESKYAKFLIAKMIVGDNEIRDIIVPEFYGHVKRLIRHPEASWIVDDIYRTLATPDQKAKLLREWYGPEFVIFQSSTKGKGDAKETADLSTILAGNPEKKGPIMQHLKELTNQLVQKKTTGYTMLHDALLQYFLNCRPGSSEMTEFLEMLKDDEGGDCYKNLAFTKSGARLVCLALAYGNSKDRRTILKFFKTHIKLLAADVNGHLVLLACYEVIDDTVMSSKAIFPELLSKDLEAEQREEELLGQAVHLVARIPILYLMSRDPPKWLLPDEDRKIIAEVRKIRTATSKKEPETRQTELGKAISQPLLDLIAARAEALVQSSFGCQFVNEVLLGAFGEKQTALEAVANLAKSGGPDHAMETPHASRMYKSLVQGGRYDPATKSIKLVDPPLDFHNIIFTAIEERFEEVIIGWALSSNSFIVVALLEAPGFNHRSEVVNVLIKQRKKLGQSESKGAKVILEAL